MSKYNEGNEVGYRSLLVGCGPLVGLPFNFIPLCAKSWQRKDLNGNSACCYPASNVALCAFPICTAWFYPIDPPRQSKSTEKVSGLKF